ncbi:hypothetical protein GCQ56_12075 [Marinifilum sp. N1E240]|uniref:RNA-binding domain-containing protein n=1 Tax=Marinifilum sp. N1E240 TaxID=2608082 RepID=UPI00128CD4FE|nr:RNA-binding domain-containing protein [Marinifilum sp. N1E240]MPQ47742.1 hypothetical protein [Marinifilum sp. N1E240]
MKKELNIYSADLHVHTPASKCYKGTKVDNEYFEILKSAKRKKLDIIAISDHNSIEGYSKLLNQKAKIEGEIDILNSLNDSNQAKKRIKELTKTLNYYNGILILPAVEFEVNNGLHMLVIFNPDTPLLKIKQFLKDGGYTSDSYGYEKSDTISNWSIFDLYEEVKNYDCLVIDGHTDSDKGILNTIPKGNTRAHAFRNSNLSGVCYKSEKQRKQLENTLNTSKEYQRQIPLAFIKSSDAHDAKDIGRSKSFFKLEQLDWNCFKSSFQNPTEYIFTNYPKVQDIIDNIIKTGNNINIPKIDTESLDDIIKSICALNNSKGGFIVLGADEKNTLLGIEVKEDKFENIEPKIDIVFEAIQNISGMIRLDFNLYPLQNERALLVFKIFGNDRLADIEENGIIYSFENQKVLILSAAKIQKKIESYTVEKIEKKIHKNLVDIESHTSKVKTSLKSLPIVSSFIENSIPLNAIAEEVVVNEPEKLELQAQQELIEYGQHNENGKSKGNIFYFEDEFAPRFKDAVLRFSIPKHYTKTLNYESKNIESVYIAPGGGVFYSKRTMPQFNTKGDPVLQLNMRKETNYSAKFLSAYLKSSFFLWLLTNRHDSINIHEPSIFTELTIPKVDFKNPNTAKLISFVEQEVDLVLKKESDFLKVKLTQENNEEEVMKHNSEIDNHVVKIDNAIYDLLELDSDTREIIEITLTANQVYLPINN